jgi:hypothetical protein
MSKKIIMLGLYGILLVLLLFTETMQFAAYQRDTIYKDKSFVFAKWPQVGDRDEVIDTLYTVSEEISADLALMVIAEDGNIDFYRTERDPSFIQLKGLDPSRSYATDPQAGEEQLRGFFFVFQDRFRIAPLRNLKGSDTERLTTRLLVNSENAEALESALTQHGAELFMGSTRFGPSENETLSFLLPTLAFFLLVSVVFYSFSRVKDMIVKKTMGYGDWDIVLSELKPLGASVLLITGGLLLLAALLFSALAGVSSTLLFFQKSASAFYLLFALSLLALAVCIRIVSGQCSVSHSKGKRLDRQLYAVTVACRTLVILVLAGNLTELYSTIHEVRFLAEQTEAAAALSEGYARMTTNINLMGSSYPSLYEFYQKMHDDHNLIIADFMDITYAEFNAEIYGEPAAEYRIDINDNYLDAFDTICDTDGALIHSDRLAAGKTNYLVPSDYDVAPMLERFARFHHSAEEYHFIRYDAAKSKFFSFSNRIEEGFAVSGEIPIVAWVADPDNLAPKTDDPAELQDAALALASFICDGVFAYDSSSELSPREQILPILRETRLEQTILETPTIRQEFMADVKIYSDTMIEQFAECAVLVMALVVLAIYAAELYYKIYAKDIAAKALAGYSFLDLFSLRMVLKLALLPVMLLMPEIYTRYITVLHPSVLASILCLTVELGLFTLCMKKNMRHKIAAVMKGE